MLGLGENPAKVDKLFDVFLVERDAASAFGYLVAFGELTLRELIAHAGTYVAQLESMHRELTSQDKRGEAFQLLVWMELASAACPDKKSLHFRVEYSLNWWLYTQSERDAEVVRESVFEVDKLNGNDVVTRFLRSKPEFERVL